MTDVVSLAGLKTNQVRLFPRAPPNFNETDTARVKPFAACNINDQFSAIGDSTGLLGLAWPTIGAFQNFELSEVEADFEALKKAQTHSTPFIQGLYESGQLDEPLFSLAFGQSGTGVGLEGAG